MSSTDSGSQALVPVSIPSVDSLGSNVQGPDSPQGNFSIDLFIFNNSVTGSVGA